jgi:hypothetical protein
MQEEVKPPQGEIVEMSLPAAPSKHAGRHMIGAKPLTGKERVERYRAKEKKKKLAAAYKYGSDVEPTKTEAKKILEARIENAHVLDCVYDLLIQAAEQLGIPANAFLFQNGVQATLQSVEQKKKPLEEKKPQLIAEIADEQVSGELLTRPELYALFDASIAWRESELTFEEFLQIRQNCKRDCFYLGKEILNKDFARCHEVWSREFFPRFDPTTLSPNYTQKQAIAWLDSQAEKKDWMLLASRNSFKSSWSHIWLLSLVLCLPDVRVLLVSETRPLSKDFIGAIRSYFETVKNQETRFQQLFPEFTLPMGDGSVLSLDCPMAHLRLAQSIESTSMDSAVAGRRADVILFDDPISSTSVGNEVQRLASVTKYDALRKLREVGGLVLILGTPWHEEDLYATLIKRNDEDEDKPLQYRLDPAWELKPEFTLNDEGKSRGLREIKEHMVDLLFPERLSWKFLQSELRSNLAFFASQNLIIFPRDEDADIRCTFDEVRLKEHCQPIGFFLTSPVQKTVLAVDTAFSVAHTADFSCLTTIRILKHEEKDTAVAWDVDLGRWPYSDLALHIVLAIQKHLPSDVVIEKDRTWVTLQREIIKQALIRGVLLPHIYWKEPAAGGTSPLQKAKRVKALEPLLANDQLWFIQSHWTDICLEQLRKFDGLTRSSASRKDDFPDSLATGIQTYFPFKFEGKPVEKTKDQLEAEKAIVEDTKRRELYRNYFGNEPVNKPARPEERPEPERNPFLRIAGGALRRRD